LFLLQFTACRNISLCGGRKLKTIASADRRHLQVQIGVLWVTALIKYLEVRFMAGHDTNKHVSLVMFAEVRAKTALTVLNCLHRAVLRFNWI
jgi:xylose isomerase